MYEGHAIKEKPSARTFRYAAIFVPIILISYSVLIQSGIIPASHVIDNVGLLMFSFWLLYISAIQFLYPSKSAFESFLRLVAYHLLAGAYLIFISGLSSPIAACWILLIVVSYMYYSMRGYIVSALTLTLFVIIDILLWNKIDGLTIFYDFVAFASIVTASFTILLILRFQKISKKELSVSKAQESLQRDRVSTIVNSLADAVFSTDMNGIIQVYNAASLNLLDTNNNLNGKNIDDILNLTDQENNTVSIINILQSANSVIISDNFFYTYNEDDKIRLEITLSPIRSSFSHSMKSNKHDGYIIIMRDITKAKSLEEERDDFISVISHELRTPITIVEGTLSNIQVMLGHPDVTNSMINDNMETAHEQILFLAGMVNDLTALSRAERGISDKKEDIDVSELAHELMNKYTDEAKANKIHLNLDIPPKLDCVRASKLYLNELLQNFITNAIKYTKKGSVTISIKQKDDNITFSVKDTGIGISKSDQSKVFDKFYRSEDYRTRESSGTGLGLYIVAKLSHKLGTKVNLTSRLNFGTTFSFTLPIVKK